MGVATKTGPNEIIMNNSRLTLTVIGYGSTAKQHNTNLKKTKNKDDCTRKTIIKVMLIIKMFCICVCFLNNSI